MIFCIVYAVLLLPFRGKRIEELTPAQMNRLYKEYNRYMRSAKGQTTPNLTIENYIPVLGKRTVFFAIIAACIAVVYIIIFMIVRSN